MTTLDRPAAASTAPATAPASAAAVSGSAATAVSGAHPAPETGSGITRRDRLILAVLLTASFTLAVDFSILNVALPVIGADVGFSLGSLQWIATSFSLFAAGFTLLFGRVADILGRRRMFLVGFAVLGVSSLVGGLADAPWMLIAARVAQGLATAAVTPAALSLLTTSFPEGRIRDRALGFNGALMAAGFTTGAIFGGVLTDVLSWRWAFFINVAVAIVVLVVAPRVLTETRPATRPRIDVPGSVTVTLALLAIVYGLSQAGEKAWTNPYAYGPLAAGAVLLVAFWAIESKVSEPLVPIRVLRRRSIAWGNAAGLVAFATETSVAFLLTLYLQKVLGFSPLAAGLSFGVLGVGTVLGGMVGPKLIGVFGAKNALVGGFLVQAASTVPLIFLGDTRAWMAVLLAATFAGGIANLVAIVGFMVTATSGLPDGEQGLATGLATMSQQIGITLGTPVMSAIATARIRSLGGPTPHAVLSGVSTALTVNAAAALVAAALVAVFLPRR